MVLPAIPHSSSDPLSRSSSVSPAWPSSAPPSLLSMSQRHDEGMRPDGVAMDQSIASFVRLSDLVAMDTVRDTLVRFVGALPDDRPVPASTIATAREAMASRVAQIVMIMAASGAYTSPADLTGAVRDLDEQRRVASAEQLLEASLGMIRGQDGVHALIEGADLAGEAGAVPLVIALANCALARMESAFAGHIHLRYAVGQGLLAEPLGKAGLMIATAEASSPFRPGAAFLTRDANDVVAGYQSFCHQQVFGPASTDTDPIRWAHGDGMNRLMAAMARVLAPTFPDQAQILRHAIGVRSQ